MRIACIIVAHKNPLQIERLIKRFNHEAFDFYIHLSGQVPIDDFKYLENRKNVHFIQNRIKVRWGAYSIVEATLSSMREVLASGQPYDYISIMSGQDYPIKPVSAIYAYLERNAGKNFICYEEGEGGNWWKHAINRVNKYHFTNFEFRGRHRLEAIVNSVLPKRKFPLPYTLYGNRGAAWMTIRPDCAQYILDFIATHKKLERFATLTWAPDEFLLPTIIMNSKFRDTVINNNFYYMNWASGSSNPTVFTTADFETLVKSDKMLARKFDINEDVAIMDMLDTKFAG